MESRRVEAEGMTRRADLKGAKLGAANLQGARLSGANLHEVLHATQEQLDGACGDEKTILPSGRKIKSC
jgi:uncharacterized protein YjbI with pentapeptide repeats